jgi:FtsH-binding integral membrane protein
VDKITPNKYINKKKNYFKRNIFIKNTYLLLGLSVLTFIGLEYIVFKLTWIINLANSILFDLNWIIILGLHIIINWTSDLIANSNISKTFQYTGYTLYLVIELFIFIPLIFINSYYINNNLISATLFISIFIFLSLTTIALVLNKNFTHFNVLLKLILSILFGLIISSVLFDYNLNILFSVIIIIVVSASFLLSTSKIFTEYSSQNYPVASLNLLSSTLVTFWHILRVLILLNFD